MSGMVLQMTEFGRLLRRAGVPVGTGQIIASADAITAIGVRSREDFRAALHATLIGHHAHRPVFDQAFDLFWRRRSTLDVQLAAMLPQTLLPPDVHPPAGARRLSDAMSAARRSDVSGELNLSVDATGSASELEALASKDFAQMSADELSAAKRALGAMDWRVRPKLSRRNAPSSAGRIDARRTLRAMLRTQGEVLSVKRRARQRIEPPLVALVDISGSMSDYSRVVLHFLHGLSQWGARDGRRISTFLFGTRLSHVTRALRHRDIDEALAMVSREAPDWDGGTRIGPALDAFLKIWARRVLGQGAHVLLVTDGLEREDPGALARAAARLKLAAKGVTWANPLMRYSGFQPKAQGMQALVPHVTRLVPIHNLTSVAALSEALSA